MTIFFNVIQFIYSQKHSAEVDRVKNFIQIFKLSGWSNSIARYKTPMSGKCDIFTLCKQNRKPLMEVPPRILGIDFLKSELGDKFEKAV